MNKQTVETLTITLRQAAQLSGIPLDSLRTYVRQKRLPAYKIGRAYRLKRAEFSEWIDSKKVE